MNDTEKQQQRMREFMQLLPVTVELAGLPHSEHGRYFTPEQIEARVITLKHAYKIARQLMADVSNQ
ncbi:MAG: hypothetical protein JNJ77_12815 [Planctomycetia bacterium]|nr:hypothetical protein [Planctomycetia bacterium]